MKFLWKTNSLISTGNWDERFPGMTIEQIAEEDGFSIIEIPDEYADATRYDIVDGEFSLLKYNELRNKDTLRQELNEIQEWFLQNDWKPNKIIREEWTKEDPRWIEYLQESAAKRSRMDQINFILLG